MAEGTAPRRRRRWAEPDDPDEAAARRAPRRSRGGPEPQLGPDVGIESDRPPLAPPDAGAGLVRADAIGTVVFVITAVVGVVAGEGALVLPLIVVSLALFAAGVVTFLWAYGIAVGRSRTDASGMGGLYFLAGSAPRSVQRAMLGLWAVQIVVGFGAAGLRVFTPVAFASLTPMFGLGMAGLWAARHGAFPPRVVSGRGRGGGDAGAGPGR